MQRILVIGGCGSGKSTLARVLAEKLELPLVHIDQLFWTDNWQQASSEAFNARLSEEVAKPAWIIDGNHSRSLPSRLERCDTVLYLDFPRLSCILGVLKRVITQHGKTRADMADNCPEKLDVGFLQYVWNFNKNYREKFYGLLNIADNIRIVVLKSRKEVARFLETL